MTKEVKEIKEILRDLIVNHNEDFFVALISIEKEIDDEEFLRDLYQRWLDSEFNLTNDEIEYLMDED